MTWFVALLGLLASSEAWAAPGDHIGTDEVVFVPSIAAGFQYQSNAYRSDTDPTPAANLNVNPALTFTATGADHSLGANASWTLRKYLTVGEAEGTGASPGQRAAALDRYDMFNVGVNADLFRQGGVGLRLSDNLSRAYWTADLEGAASPYVTQMRNTAYGGLRLSPGEALEIVPGVTWQRDEYIYPTFNEADDPENNVRNAIGPQVDARWSFLPRTAFLAHLGAQFSSWQENEIEAADGPLPLPNSTAVRGSVGVAGRLTDRIAAEFLIGYGTALFDVGSLSIAAQGADQNLGGLAGLTIAAQARYLLTRPTSPAGGGDPVGGSSIALGYLKDYRLPYFTNYASSHTVYADFAGRFDRIGPHLRYALRADAYDGAIVRNDLVGTATAGVQFYAAEYAILEARFDYLSRTSSNDAVEFDNAIVSLNATFRY